MDENILLFQCFFLFITTNIKYRITVKMIKKKELKGKIIKQKEKDLLL